MTRTAFLPRQRTDRQALSQHRSRKSHNSVISTGRSGRRNLIHLLVAKKFVPLQILTDNGDVLVLTASMSDSKHVGRCGPAR